MGISKDGAETYTFSDFAAAMAERFVEVVSAVHDLTVTRWTLTADEHISRLISLGPDIFQVTAFLIENQLFIDEDSENWIDTVFATNTLRVHSGRDGHFSPDQLNEFMGYPTQSIAQIVMAAYCMQVDDLVQWNAETGHQRDLTALTNLSTQIKGYVVHPQLRVLLHEQVLPVFDDTRYDDGLLRGPHIERLASFACATGNDITRGNTWQRLAQIFALRFDIPLRPHLVALCELLPDIVDHIDDAMRYVRPRSYHMNLYTESMDLWEMTHNPVSNRPFSGEENYDDQFFFLSELIVERPNNKKPQRLPHPFSPYVEVEGCGPNVNPNVPVRIHVPEVREPGVMVPLSASRANWLEAKGGLQVVLIPN